MTAENDNYAKQEEPGMSEGKHLIRLFGITVTVYLVIKYSLPYIFPFLMAYVLVHLLNPLTEKIHRKIPWRKEIIVSVLLVLILGVCTFLFYWIYCMLMDQIRKVAMNFDLYYAYFCRWIDDCCFLAERKLGIRVDEIRTFVYTSLEDASQQIRVYIIPGVFNYSVKYLKKLFAAALFLLILFVAVILLIKDYDEMKKNLQQYHWFFHVHHITQRLWKQGGMYMRAQGTIIGVVMLLCAVGLWVLGNPYFLLLGIIIGLTDALPFIGTGTILLPITLFYLIGGSIRLALGYAGLFLLTYIVREFMEPRLIGAKLGIYPFVLVVTVYTGLYLYGAAGVLLGPVTLLAVMEINRELRIHQTEKEEDSEME